MTRSVVFALVLIATAPPVGAQQSAQGSNDPFEDICAATLYLTEAQ